MPTYVTLCIICMTTYAIVRLKTRASYERADEIGRMDVRRMILAKRKLSSYSRFPNAPSWLLTPKVTLSAYFVEMYLAVRN